MSFSTQNLALISVRKAKNLDVTTMFTYSHANTPLGQSEGTYYLSYFIKGIRVVQSKGTTSGKFLLVESEIQLKDYGSPLATGIQKPSPTDVRH